MSKTGANSVSDCAIALVGYRVSNRSSFMSQRCGRVPTPMVYAVQAVGDIRLPPGYNVTSIGFDQANETGDQLLTIR
ncbi:Uncharacterised protein [Serratia odorifera]|uniref:Uncharacterized protein n=1 Tax=Serratia odorifera TaxID=618 RepID=A0A3S4E7U6_SEROD|nr:Uncharacterised protein [Serratia odorifera]